MTEATCLVAKSYLTLTLWTATHQAWTRLKLLSIISYFTEGHFKEEEKANIIFPSREGGAKSIL